MPNRWATIPDEKYEKVRNFLGLTSADNENTVIKAAFDFIIKKEGLNGE